MNKLVIILSLISHIGCATICGEDGLVINTHDNTSYFECRDGIPQFVRCPRSDDGLVYLIFDGRECVDSRRDRPLTNSIEPEPVNNDDRAQTQDQELVCPPDTIFDRSLGKCRGEDLAEPIRIEEPVPFVSYSCETGLTYDATRNKCVKVDYEDPILVEGPDYKSICTNGDGKYPDPRNRRLYFICEKHIARQQACPKNTLFSSEGGGQCLSPSDIMINDEPDVAPPENPPVGQPEDPEHNIQPRQYNAGDRDQVECHRGYVYDRATGQCRRDEVADPVEVPVVEDLRVDVTCPPGSVYDSPSGRCRKDEFTDPIEVRVDNRQTDATCPSGTVYDRLSGKCSRVEVTDPIVVTDTRQTGTTECPPNSEYDRRTGRCRMIVDVPPVERRTDVSSPRYICPPGYNYNRSTGRCERFHVIDPISQPYPCPSDTYYDPVSRRCIGDRSPVICQGQEYCPANYTMDHDARRCSSKIIVPAILRRGNRTFTCEQPYEYDRVLNKCIFCEEQPPIPIVTTELICADGYQRRGNMCYRTVSTPLVVNYSNGTCPCPPGFEWKPRMFQCVKIHPADCIVGPCPPVQTYDPYRPTQHTRWDEPVNPCPSGFTYDNTIGGCTGVIAPGPADRRGSICAGEPFCPYGFNFDTTRTNCIQEIEIPPSIITTTRYECTVGYTYDVIFHICRTCQVRPPFETPKPDQYDCPQNGAGHFILDLYNRQCVKTIWIDPLTNHTRPPCKCPSGYFLSQSLTLKTAKCVMITTRPCIEGPCPNPRPYPPPTLPPINNNGCPHNTYFCKGFCRPDPCFRF